MLHNTTIYTYVIQEMIVLAGYKSDLLLQQSITDYSDMSLTTNHRTLLHKILQGDIASLWN